MLENKKIGFIGAGQMCEAIFSGILKSNLVESENIWVSDIDKTRLDFLREKYNIKTLDNQNDAGSLEIAQQCDVVVLSVKPQLAVKVLSPLKNKISKNAVTVSIVGGITLEKLETILGNCAIIRVMPNTPMLVGKGVAGMAPNSLVSTPQLETVTTLFGCVGSVYTIAENLIDPLTGISGCGPAFAYMFIEALADGGVAQGLPRDMAISLAAQTLAGSAEMVIQTGVHPEKLKDNVCSPGGSTIAGVHSLEKNAFRAAVSGAVSTSCEKMKEIGKKA